MRLLFLVLAWAAALWRAPAHADDPGHNGAIHTAAIHLVAPAPGAPGRDVAVIWLSGDGGWGRMERQMTARLAASGVATVGFSTLEYYAKARTPAQGAALVARLESEAETRFGTHSFVLAGFSFGADVAPFVANALPAAMRARLVFVTLPSPGRRASFQVGPRTWLNLQDGPEGLSRRSQWS